MQTIKKLSIIFDKKAKIQFLVLLVLVIFGAFLEMLTIAAVTPLVSILLNNSLIETNKYLKFFYNFIGFGDVRIFLAVLTFFLAILYIGRGAYNYILTRIQFKFLARKQVGLSDHLLHKILKLPYLYHTTKNLSELQHIIITDCVQMFTLIGSILILLTDIFMMLFILIFLCILSPEITLGILVISLSFALIYFKFFRKIIVKAGKKRWESEIGMKKSVNQALGGIKEIKIMHCEDYFHKTFKQFSDRYINESNKFRTLDALPRLLIESIILSGVFILVGILILTGTDVTVLIPQLSIFILAAFRLLPAVTRQMNNINKIINNQASVNAIYNILFIEDSALYSHPARHNQPTDNFNNILVCDLTFQYPNTLSPVLIKISLTIPEKKSVAFIGPSGGGKTTLIDIILGLLKPDSGYVLFNGESVHDNFENWRANVGYIPQQIYLLDQSILENIAFGIKPDEIDIIHVWKVVEQAQLSEFVSLLPDGLETIVGERGIRLSGGQRQRIGIARALYNNPSILFLDEATSSLDTETEKAVIEAIENFRGEKTMIIIAHRFSTIENCDIIYRVEDGTVVRVK